MNEHDYREELERVENRIMNHVAEIYVSKQACGEKSLITESHVQKLEIAMAKVSTKMSVMIGILGAIGVSILGVVIKSLFGG